MIYERSHACLLANSPRWNWSSPVWKNTLSPRSLRRPRAAMLKTRGKKPNMKQSRTGCSRRACGIDKRCPNVVRFPPAYASATFRARTHASRSKFMSVCRKIRCVPASTLFSHKLLSLSSKLSSLLGGVWLSRVSSVLTNKCCRWG